MRSQIKDHAQHKDIWGYKYDQWVAGAVDPTSALPLCVRCPCASARARSPALPPGWRRTNVALGWPTVVVGMLQASGSDPHSKYRAKSCDLDQPCEHYRSGGRVRWPQGMDNILQGQLQVEGVP